MVQGPPPGGEGVTFPTNVSQPSPPMVEPTPSTLAAAAPGERGGTLPSSPGKAPGKSDALRQELEVRGDGKEDPPGAGPVLRPRQPPTTLRGQGRGPPNPNKINTPPPE